MPEDQKFGSREIERRTEDFVGKTVTMAGKDGGVWERTTITGLDGAELLLSGGAWVRNRFAEVAVREPVEGMVARVWKYDIARGVIHRACWVLTDPGGEDHDHGEGVAHFADEAQAATHASEHGLDQQPRQLDRPCTTIACSVCEYAFDKDAGGVVHFEHAGEISEVLPEYGWAADDRGWRCGTCTQWARDLEAGTRG